MCLALQKSLKIPKGWSESVYQRRTDNTMAKRLCFSVTIFFLLFSNIYLTLSSFSIIRDNFIQKYESYIIFWHPLLFFLRFKIPKNYISNWCVLLTIDMLLYFCLCLKLLHYFFYLIFPHVKNYYFFYIIFTVCSLIWNLKIIFISILFVGVIFQ
jgi:hypothetical protein